MRISDWSSDVCSSDLPGNAGKRDFDRISDQLLDFDRRETRVNRIDLNLLVGDVGDGVDRQLGELPDSETRAEEEEEEDRPAGSEARRGGEACVSTGSTRGSPYT